MGTLSCAWAAPARAVYRPRRPRRSPLYRLLEEHFEDFLLSYEERYRRRHGPLRSELTRRTVYKYLDCGILDHGFARVACPGCRAEFLIAYSCKTRLCPSCHAKKLTLWSDRLVEELLEAVPHRMITLTVPKRIRPFLLWDRRLLGLLARCAAETIRTAPFSRPLFSLRLISGNSSGASFWRRLSGRSCSARESRRTGSPGRTRDSTSTYLLV